MTMRHRTRHIHKTLCDVVLAGLTKDGWITDPLGLAGINYGATAVTFMEIQPEEAGLEIQPNTVAVTLGNQAPMQEAELGGGLYASEYVFYVDVYGESWSVTASLCDDIRTYVEPLRMQANDYTTGTAVASTDHFIEIDEVQEDDPPAAGAGDRRYWRVLSGVLTVYLPG